MPSVGWIVEVRLLRRRLAETAAAMRRADAILSRTDIRPADDLTTLLLVDAQDEIRAAIAAAEDTP